jgi:2-amino-4-hydroxy-6-hydroxymethyldihydropteridine diphosphokinase
MPEQRPAEALLAFGGNVGDSRAILGHTVAALCDGEAVRLKARSSDYRTPPWGDTDQAPFVNLCIAIETGLSPSGLLARAQSVETQFGRDRAKERPWGPRTCDIDIIDYDSLAIDEPGLILPHPRLFERAFVLVPLVEIAPDRIVGGKSLREALSGLDASGIERLPPQP